MEAFLPLIKCVSAVTFSRCSAEGKVPLLAEKKRDRGTVSTVYWCVCLGRCDWACEFCLMQKCRKIALWTKCKELNNNRATKECVREANGGAVTWVGSLCGLQQMQLKCCYQRQQGPRAKLEYPNCQPPSTLLHPPPLPSPSPSASPNPPFSKTSTF